jgi:hypothetical protein
MRCRRLSQEAKRIGRECKKCSKPFSVYPSVLSGKSNASALFCSAACYHNWMANEERTKNYGPRWRLVRGEARELASFCALCGTSKGLDVHHIVPYRVRPDNDQNNLIALCKRHHKRVEMLTQEIIATGVDLDQLWQVMNSNLSMWQAATFQTLKQLGYSKRYAPRTC